MMLGLSAPVWPTGLTLRGQFLSLAHSCADHRLWFIPSVQNVFLCSSLLCLAASSSRRAATKMQNSLLFLTDYCKSGFPVSWALLPRGHSGKVAVSWNADSQPVILAVIPARSSLHFQTSSAVYATDLLVHLCGPRVKVWASLKGKGKSQSVLSSQWLSDCGGRWIAKQLENSLSQKAFKIHGCHEEVTSSEPWRSSGSTKNLFSALNGIRSSNMLLENIRVSSVWMQIATAAHVAKPWWILSCNKIPCCGEGVITCLRDSMLTKWLESSCSRWLISPSTKSCSIPAFCCLYHLISKLHTSNPPGCGPTEVWMKNIRWWPVPCSPISVLSAGLNFILEPRTSTSGQSLGCRAAIAGQKSTLHPCCQPVAPRPQTPWELFRHSSCTTALSWATSGSAE